MEVEEIFEEISKNMKCNEIVTIGSKDSYKEGELKRQNYYLVYFNGGVKCSLTFTKTYDNV